MDGARELDRIAVALDVHVERHGLGAQQVVVQRADLDAAFLELAHDRGHLVLRQHEIAHDHGLRIHRLEGDPAAERKARPERHAVERHFEVGAREAHAVDAAGLHGAGFAERLCDLGPVRLGGEGRRREDDGANQRYDKTNDRMHGDPPQSSFSVIFFTSSPFIRTTTATGRPPSSAGVTLTAR